MCRTPGRSAGRRYRAPLLDEPTQGTEPAVAARAYGLSRHAVKAEGRTVLLAEQRFGPGLRGAGTVVRELRRGTVAFSGEPLEMPRPRQAR